MTPLLTKNNVSDLHRYIYVCTREKITKLKLQLILKGLGEAKENIIKNYPEPEGDGWNAEDEIEAIKLSISKLI